MKPAWEMGAGGAGGKIGMCWAGSIPEGTCDGSKLCWLRSLKKAPALLSEAGKKCIAAIHNIMP